MFDKLSHEEKLNTLSHAFGVLFGVVALILLVWYNNNKTNWSFFSVIVYGLSIIILFTTSTVYHATKNDTYNHIFRVLDHMSIYLLIAGTYTPICLILLDKSLGNTLFFAVWGMALFGLILKFFFTGRFEIFSTALYLVMGWLIVFDFSNLYKAIGENGILLLFAGGVAYTVGIVFYAIKQIPYNHFIWHVFVLAGAVFHFFMIFFYVI